MNLVWRNDRMFMATEETSPWLLILLRLKAFLMQTFLRNSMEFQNLTHFMPGRSMLILAGFIFFLIVMLLSFCFIWFIVVIIIIVTNSINMRSTFLFFSSIPYLKRPYPLSPCNKSYPCVLLTKVLKVYFSLLFFLLVSFQFFLWSCI